MGEVYVLDILAAMEELGGYLDTALHGRKPEVDLVTLAVTVLRRSLTDDERNRTIVLRTNGAIGVKVGCSPKA